LKIQNLDLRLKIGWSIWGLLLPLLMAEAAFAQTYTGKVIDAQTGEPLPYVNVGIVGQNVGTVTDIEGVFKIRLDDEHDRDSLKISMIGYESRSWKVFDYKFIAKDSIVRLRKSNYEINQVEINSKRLRSKLLGSTTTSEFFTGGFTSNDLGNEIGVRINVGRKPVYLQNFSFNIAQNNCDSLLFRVNVYSLKNDEPDSSLLHENVLVGTRKKSGLITVDMLPYALQIDDDFVIALEFIRPCPDRALQFSAAFLGSIYSRVTSQGTWEKLKGFDLGFNVKVLR